MQGAPSGPILHVVNGESVAATLRPAPLAGDVLSWQDVLHEGPVPLLAPPELREVRARFLADSGFGDEPEILEELSDRDRVFDEALLGGRPVVLWFEHDLHDQLQLLQVLARIAELGARGDHVELIAVDSYPGRPHFRGLGELTAAELETLWPGRRQVTEPEIAVAWIAWEALRQPDPTAIEDFLALDSGALPFLAAALHRLLEELPETGTGLSRSERQLLEALAERRRTRGGLFLAAQEAEEAPYAGDTWVWKQLAELSSGEQPLVSAGSIVELTEGGRAVLAGDADRVELLGIDRWLGGTHLLPGRLWRWDRAAERLSPPV